MGVIFFFFFFNYCINTPPKRFAWFQNKFFRHFIPFLLNIRGVVFVFFFFFFFFSKTPHQSRGLMSGLESCLIAVLTVFSWTFNSLECFLIYIAGFFSIAVARAVKKKTFFSVFFCFFVVFFFCSILHSPFYLKSSFFCKKKIFPNFVYSSQSNLVWFRC